MLEFNGWFDKTANDRGYHVGKAFWEDFDYDATLSKEKGGFRIDIESMEYHFEGAIAFDVWFPCKRNGLKVKFHSEEVGAKDYIAFVLRDI